MCDQFIEDDDILWFCCRHNLSIMNDDYSDDEFYKLKRAALREQRNKRIRRKKIQEVLCAGLEENYGEY